MNPEMCPECGEELENGDILYIETSGVCKCCYDDNYFGEEDE